jgi:hypothetical protein
MSLARPAQFLRQISERFSRGDILQLALLFFVVLLFSFMFGWPSSNREANDAWFQLAQTRLFLLVLLALGFGSTVLAKEPTEQQSTLLALWYLALVSLPLELAAYAASYPSQRLSWVISLPLVDTAAFYGLGLFLGQVIKVLRLELLLPLAIPSALVGIFALAIRFDLPLNPLSALLNTDLSHLILMSFFAIMTLVYLWRRRKAKA